MFLKVLIPILLCFLPVILCFFIFKGMKVKSLHLGAAILLGLIAVLPISFMQFFLPYPALTSISPVFYSLLKSLIFFGLIEEGIKALLISPLPGKKDNSPLNFLLLAFMFGITVGSFESVVYYLDRLQKAANRGASILYIQIFLRMFSSDIIHLTCAGLSGIFIYTVATKKTKVSCFIYSFILHGLYDFFVAFQNNLKWFAIIVILLAVIECRSKYSTLTEKSETQ